MQHLPVIVSFIQSIGIDVHFRPIDTDCFLPGISIDAGQIVVDESRLRYPGDLLHEAGHIAVVPQAERHTLNAQSIGERKDRAAEEMMAIAWSYAACLHIGLDPYVVFHENGYDGGGQSIVDAFRYKNGFGVPMLQYAGMSYEQRRAAEYQAAPFPEMVKWLRD